MDLKLTEIIGYVFSEKTTVCADVFDCTHTYTIHLMTAYDVYIESYVSKVLGVYKM